MFRLGRRILLVPTLRYDSVSFLGHVSVVYSRVYRYLGSRGLQRPRRCQSQRQMLPDLSLTLCGGLLAADFWVGDKLFEIHILGQFPI